MPNDLLVTTTDILGIEVAKDYSGASGIYVDNVNNIISITGDVGKEYNGIEPIVVNNEENLISANSAPIGVQEPLYFVQDDDEAVVIGLSGEYVTPSDITGKLDTSSFESWQQGQYTNDLTAINEKINEVSSSIPSIEGLATEQLVEETSATIVSQIPSTAGLASETYVQEQTSGKASKSDLETVSGDIVNLIPSTAGLASEDWVESQGYLTAHQSLENYYSKDETSGAEQLAEAFNNIPQGDEAVNDVVHTYSANGTWLVADDITGFQEKGDYYSASNPSGFLVSDDISDLASISLVEDTSASITALIPTDYYPNSNPSGFITGVDLSNYYQKNETSSKEEISVAIAAIPLGDEEVNQAVHTNSATWNTVTDKLDTTSFSEVSGTFLTAHQSLEGYATETLVEETSGAITSLIPTDYYPDTNPSGFISGVDLTPYQTIEGMTAYQPAGSYATTNELEQVSGDITALIPSTAGLASESYVQTNSAVLTGMIDGKQDTLTFGYDEQDRINSINNSALAGGGDVPEDVMVETNLEYNAVGEISGYGNSAIAQYGAEKQWLVHDDTLVHASNSAQYALGVNLSALQRLMGIDETVLWSGDAFSGISASEPMTGFNRIRIKYSTNTNSTLIYGSVHEYKEIDPSTLDYDFTIGAITNNGINSTNKMLIINTEYSATSNYTVLNMVHTYQVYNNSGTWATGTNNTIRIKELVGIGRKQ